MDVRSIFDVNEDRVGFLRLSNHPVSQTVEASSDILIDLDCEGRPVAVEVIYFDNTTDREILEALDGYGVMESLYLPRAEFFNLQCPIANTCGSGVSMGNRDYTIRQSPLPIAIPIAGNS